MKIKSSLCFETSHFEFWKSVPLVLLKILDCIEIIKTSSPVLMFSASLPLFFRTCRIDLGDVSHQPSSLYPAIVLSVFVKDVGLSVELHVGWKLGRFPLQGSRHRTVLPPLLDYKAHRWTSGQSHDVFTGPVSTCWPGLPKLAAYLHPVFLVKVKN